MTAVLSEIRIFYDQQGQARDVLISYETFEKIIQALSQTDDQAYIWTADWRRRIAEAEADVQYGRGVKATAETLESAFNWLDEQ